LWGVRRGRGGADHLRTGFSPSGLGSAEKKEGGKRGGGGSRLSNGSVREERKAGGGEIGLLQIHSVALSVMKMGEKKGREGDLLGLFLSARLKDERKEEE